jgi:hypothetical protein
MNWYSKTIKTANEFGPVDGLMGPRDIVDQGTFKSWSSDSAQGLEGVSLSSTGIEDVPAGRFGIETEKCGSEPGSRGGCGYDLKDWAEWHDYGVIINGDKYRSYKCKHCKHSLEPFNIYFTNKKKLKHNKKRKNKKSRLGANLTDSSMVKTAVPGNPMAGGGYNNPANEPLGRLDLSQDSRMFEWKKIDPDFEYDSWHQKNHVKERKVKIKDKNGKDVTIKVRFMGSEDPTMPANVVEMKGTYTKDLPRYNPAKGDAQHSPGSWPHNRNIGRENYPNEVDSGNKFDESWRQRVTPWADYIRERNQFLLTMTKPM